MTQLDSDISAIYKMISKVETTQRQHSRDLKVIEGRLDGIEGRLDKVKLK